MLTAESLTLGYENNTIIESLNLNITKGSFTVLVGSNGCGKSTLLKGLSHLIRASKGSVLLFNEEMEGLSRKTIARQLGILPQNPQTPEGLTVEELVRQGRYAHHGFFPKWNEGDRKTVREALSICDLNDIKHCNINNLSGGQKQRAWIAMALAQESEILMMDEPTSALDLKYQIEILDLLKKLNRDGRTIILVLHDINMACRYANHIIAMKEGRIIKVGHPKDVVDHLFIQEVFSLKAHIIDDPITNTPLIIPVGSVFRI
ncbi:ABC transporter ATP-binding protein [Spirochaeta cellobiosiphila]|uniref:ABC transporter ATP-binding protein n=1 Tax=Spirochaeta cellobiosiphila TaxID=504483 RepID=UPI00040EE411|nr:ABC transporter ATP-binding protein [Spirochaeta cellobiosiphila]